MKRTGNPPIYILLFAFLFTACLSVKTRTGDSYYEQLQYKEAIPFYEYSLKKKYNFDVMLKLADCYRNTKNYIRAEQLYREITQIRKDQPIYKLYFAEALMQNGKYADAKEWFQKYLEINRTDERAERLMLSCDSVQKFFEDSAHYNISQLKLNKGAESNYSPCFYKSGIVFVSNRYDPLLGSNKNRPADDYNLFYAKKTEAGVWLDPEPLRGNVNSIFDEGPATFNRQFNKLYFTRNNNDGEKIILNKNDVNVLKIYRAELQGVEWKVIGEMSFNSNDYSAGHPVFSANGMTVYFVSDMPWGYGGTDIYQSNFVNGLWTRPVNLGKNINTTGDDMFPFLLNDSVLYFSSDGHAGLGGLDIMRTEKINGEWQLPENIGYPINSSKDDFGLITDSTDLSGYFSSNRNGGIDRIYSFSKNPPVFKLQGTVTEKGTGKPLKNIPLRLSVALAFDTTLVTDANGNFSASLRNSCDYGLFIKEKNYFFNSLIFSTRGKRKSQTLTENITVEKINYTKPYLWYGIAFEKNSDNLLPAATPELNRLYEILKNNSHLRIELSCHTDSRGPDKDNLILSQRRADAAAEYLFAKGIDRSRIIAVGYGETKLLNECKNGILCLEEDHRLNIRTEIKILNPAN